MNLLDMMASTWNASGLAGLIAFPVHALTATEQRAHVAN